MESADSFRKGLKKYEREKKRFCSSYAGADRVPPSAPGCDDRLFFVRQMDMNRTERIFCKKLCGTVSGSGVFDVYFAKSGHLRGADRIDNGDHSSGNVCNDLVFSETG